MGKLKTADILNSARQRAAETREVPVPAWGGDVTIRRLSTVEVTELTERFISAGEDGKLQEDSLGSNKYLFAHSVVEPAFTDEEVDELWANEGVDATGEVLKAIRIFNGLGKEAQKEELHSFPVQE